MYKLYSDEFRLVQSEPTFSAIKDWSAMLQFWHKQSNPQLDGSYANLFHTRFCKLEQDKLRKASGSPLDRELGAESDQQRDGHRNSQVHRKCIAEALDENLAREFS